MGAAPVPPTVNSGLGTSVGLNNLRIEGARDRHIGVGLINQTGPVTEIDVLTTSRMEFPVNPFNLLNKVLFTNLVTDGTYPYIIFIDSFTSITISFSNKTGTSTKT